MFKRFMTRLRGYAQQFPDVRKGGNHLLADHHGFEQQWLCALDGVQYFSSDAIHCDHCTRRLKGTRRTIHIA